MIDKSILMDYFDSCELVKETEREIKRLSSARGTVCQDIVTGSNPEFPYEPRHFHIEGVKDVDNSRLERKEEILRRQKAEAEKKREAVEVWMLCLPSRMQRIIRFRFFEGLPWEQVADRLGRGATGDSVRKELDKFIKN